MACWKKQLKKMRGYKRYKSRMAVDGWGIGKFRRRSRSYVNRMNKKEVK